MADKNPTKQQAAPITDKQIADVEELLRTLKGKANDAVKGNDLYMAAVYADLVKVVSPVVNRAYARKDREEKAAINKNVRNLRASNAPAQAGNASA